MKHSLELAACVAVLLGLILSGIVGFHDYRIVKNDPLIAPVTVVSLSDNVLELADGRKFRVDGYSDSLSEALKLSGNRIDIEPFGSNGAIDIKGYRFRTICGVGRPMFSVPVRRQEINQYDRKWLAHGELIETTDGNAAKPTDEAPVR